MITGIGRLFAARGSVSGVLRILGIIRRIALFRDFACFRRIRVRLERGTVSALRRIRRNAVVKDSRFPLRSTLRY